MRTEHRMRSRTGDGIGDAGHVYYVTNLHGVM